MRSGFGEFWRAVKQLCFPPVCLVCDRDLATGPGRPDIALCQPCLDRITPLCEPLCTCCGRPFLDAAGGSHLCSFCLNHRHYFSCARGLALYREPLTTLLHSFKYGGHTTALPFFAHLGKRYAGQWLQEFPDWILPVPLHPRRLRERGFNQALSLARLFFPAERRTIDCHNLIRHRWTAPQTGLSGQARRRNIRDAFRLRVPRRVTGKRILLIDDVYTTGATVDECARLLKRAGAADIQVLTLARVEE